MRTIGTVLGLLAVLCNITPAVAGGCGVYRQAYNGYSYHQKTVITHAPAVFVEVPVFQVLFGTAVVAPGAITIAPLAPAAAPQAPAVAAPPATLAPAKVAADPQLKAAQDENRALKARLADMEKRLNATAPPTAPVKPEAQPPAGESRMQQAFLLLESRCSACHHETVSKDKKSNFDLFRGGELKGGTFTGSTLLAVADVDLDAIALRVGLAETAKGPGGEKPMPPVNKRDTYPGFTVSEQDDVRWLVARLKADRAK